MPLITTIEYMMGRDREYPPTDEMLKNSVITVQRANELLKRASLDRRVVSGYRPAEINAMVKGAAPNSKHTICAAVDLEDHDGKLGEWCIENLGELADIGLWMEHKGSTPTWVHVQIYPPKSGNRVFIP